MSGQKRSLSAGSGRPKSIPVVALKRRKVTVETVATGSNSGAQSGKQKPQGKKKRKKTRKKKAAGKLSVITTTAEKCAVSTKPKAQRRGRGRGKTRLRGRGRGRVGRGRGRGVAAAAVIGNALTEIRKSASPRPMRKVLAVETLGDSGTKQTDIAAESLLITRTLPETPTPKAVTPLLTDNLLISALTTSASNSPQFPTADASMATETEFAHASAENMESLRRKALASMRATMFQRPTPSTDSMPQPMADSQMAEVSTVKSTETMAVFSETASLSTSVKTIDICTSGESAKSGLKPTTSDSSVSKMESSSTVAKPSAASSGQLPVPSSGSGLWKLTQAQLRKVNTKQLCENAKLQIDAVNAEMTQLFGSVWDSPFLRTPSTHKSDAFLSETLDLMRECISETHAIELEFSDLPPDSKLMEIDSVAVAPKHLDQSDLDLQ